VGKFFRTEESVEGGERHLELIAWADQSDAIQDLLKTVLGCFSDELLVAIESRGEIVLSETIPNIRLAHLLNDYRPLLFENSAGAIFYIRDNDSGDTISAFGVPALLLRGPANSYLDVAEMNGFNVTERLPPRIGALPPTESSKKLLDRFIRQCRS
jgi:hypothetical protein